ncbi:MAG: hypothetical protein P0Y53_07155 [Candidatus Pseudobacter hemicellulosilyticus]|uniref:Uncharacterized protein n=1 Tax=Candidatus Pseudobacter hemicellulosilyticus TaxID=3121375 RepID=A0AAJ5WW45_9BACT|nr:MAG: hypothetical protein P0Y53_07155 [Pseudobacter sp.]
MTAIETKSLKVGRFVDTAHVDTVIREYKHKRWAQNSERIGKEDSLSAWYSVEDVEDFIAKVKENGGNGIRLYFAAYPEDYVARPEYAGRQTIVFVGTKNKETETGLSSKDIYITTDKGSSILAYNAGTICPPTCPGSRKPGAGDSDWDGLGVTIVDRGDKGLTIV